MCGRFTSLLSPELLAAIFNIFPPPPAVDPRYNIAPTQQAWVVRSDGSRNHLEHMKWGLIPSWAKDPKIGNSLINARSETVHEKPSFRHAIKTNRCIIPASGFYEWQHIGEKKIPNYIHMADHGVMAFAGVWEHWKFPEEDTFLESFSILTTTANELIAPLHDRMPVILRPEDYAMWLDTQIKDPGQLQHLYQPITPGLLTMYRVTKKMNSPKFIDPECIAPV
jgi:putative SOS response-associated peptidase YedK